MIGHACDNVTSGVKNRSWLPSDIVPHSRTLVFFSEHVAGNIFLKGASAYNPLRTVMGPLRIELDRFGHYKILN